VVEKENSNIKKAIDIEEITPEIAATVVREYLLPLFEKDSRKTVRDKRLNDMNSPRRKARRSIGSQEVVHRDKGKKSMGDDKTLYGELKLSEQLSLEIMQLRNEKNIQHEEIEDTKLKNNILEKRLA